LSGLAVLAGASPWVRGRAAAELTRTDGVTVPGVRTASHDAAAAFIPPFPTDYVAVLAGSGALAGPVALAVQDIAGDVSTVAVHVDCAATEDGRGRAASALTRVSAPALVEVTASLAVTLLAVDASSGAPILVPASSLSSNPWTRETLDALLEVIGREAYLSRSDWGADESLRFDENGVERWGAPPSYHPAQTLTVHHTATDNDDPDPAATVRAIYRLHTIERGFGDIGYQLLIDEAGRLYEGRYSGDDVLPGHDLDLRGVQGAHVGGRNSGNFGVALLGNFVEERPTAPALATLVAVLAVLATVHGLDPEADTTYRSPVLPEAPGVDIATVPGHRDWSATECPGDHLYSQLDWLRAQAARLMAEPGPGTLALIATEALVDGRARPAG
jgi:hypothetical protein